MSTPIAITGMACRFSGAPDLTGFWDMVTSGTVARGRAGRRWHHAAFHRPDDPRHPDGIYTDTVAHLDEVRSFGARHFGVPPRRARAMDPQHRLLIELTRQALQDAGLERRPFRRDRTGVYVGISASEYQDLTMSRSRARQLASGDLGPGLGQEALREQVLEAAEAVAPLSSHSISGCLRNMGAAGISGVFDFGGPCVVLDAACASSLAAVHEAVGHLRTGQCETAVVGGSYLNLVPDPLIAFSRLGVLSRAGVCRPFDRRADGFVLGEGAGVAVLRPLEAALADNDRIYAVIRGSACTNDGSAGGPTHPSQAAQQTCMENAYRDAGVPAHSVDFLECHGTATAAGDRAELAALHAVWADAPPEMACHLSSVKANIGHTMAAAGIAGLIKAALVVHHGLVPPQPDGPEPHPDLLTGHRPFALCHQARPWPDQSARPRRAGVSAFGFGGTNVHVVLERPTRLAAQRAAPVIGGDVLCLLTADSTPLLAEHARQLAAVLRRSRDLRLGDIATTLASRTPLVARAVVAASRTSQLADRLTTLAGLLNGDRPLPPWAATSPQHATPAVAALLTSATPAVDATPGSATGRLVSLPPSPIETSDYWIVDHQGRRTAPAKATTEPLVAAICHVTQFEPGEVDLDHAVVRDLGFDSLMADELVELLSAHWPGLPTLTGDLLTPTTTVRDLALWLAAQPTDTTQPQAAAPTPSAAPSAGPFVAQAPAETRHPQSLQPRPAGADIAGQLERMGLPSPYFAVHDGPPGPTTKVNGQPMITFSSYDYLGLSGDPVVAAAAKTAVDRYGTSVSASRVAAGERPVHAELEDALAGHLGAEQAVVMVSGHATNVEALGHLMGPGDLIVHDELAHNSILHGARLSGARHLPFAHNDVGALDRLLQKERSRHRRVLIAVEGVYSMDGDLADLPALTDLRRRHDVMLYLDEAHSIGVLGATGAGAAEHFGIPAHDLDLRMGTLSKALASCGGYVAGSAQLITYLRHTTPGFLYSVGMPPAVAAAALAALRRLRSEPQLAATARRRAEAFRRLAQEAGLNTGLSMSGSCVVPVITGNGEQALLLADRMRRRGIDVPPFLPPAVREAHSRLRFFLTAQHSESHVRHTVGALVREVAALTHGPARLAQSAVSAR